MPPVAYASTGTLNTARILFGNHPIGLVFKETNYVGGGGPHYVVDVHSDPRGPKRVRNRSLLSEIVQDRISTHPKPWRMLLSPATSAETSPCIPF